MRFSIIIPTYNRAAFLPKAIGSVLAQSFSDWELIIVDDGSTDNTKDVVAQYSDSRITYIFQQNAERSAARNKGIAHSVGEYVLFLDSDDYYLSNFLADLNLEIRKNNNKPCLYFHNALIESNGKQRQFAEPLPNGEKNILIFLFDNFRVIGVCQAATARCFFAENMFDTRFSLWEDTHLFFRLLAQFSFKQLSVQGYVAVQHEQSTVIAGSRQVKMADVERYILAINDLESNYWNLFSKYLTEKDFQNYRDSKLNMYLYMARTNCQYDVAYSIAKLVLKNRFSLKNVVTCLKLVVHKIIGR